MLSKVVPLRTSPLAKFIRTGEGVLVFAFNAALLVVPIVSNALTAAQSVKYAVWLNGVVVVARTALKVIAVLKTQQPGVLSGTGQLYAQAERPGATPEAGVQAGAGAPVNYEHYESPADYNPPHALDPQS